LRLQSFVRSKPHAGPIILIAIAVVAVNTPPLLGIVTTSPLQMFSGLQAGQTSQALPGLPTIDPNAGYLTFAVGHLAASDLLHAHLPWWNPYEGLGTPLAGGMQPAAFFAPTLLLQNPTGFVAFHIVLEVTAGWSTYFLLRRLGIGRSVATAGGVAFGLCGTLAWLANAAANPVPFLPLALLGVEQALDAARDRDSGGWAVLGLALGLSVVAGFPETAYLNGLLVATWASVRLATLGSARWRAASKLALGLAVGALLSAPTLVAFLDYLPHADVGAHSGAFGGLSLPAAGLPQTLLPYGYGPIFGFHSVNSTTLDDVWGGIGGYVSAALLVCATVGLVGRRCRPLRLVLGAWIALALMKTFGLEPIAGLVTRLPGLDQIATYRYGAPSWEMAVVVLAAFGLDDMAKRRVRPLVILGAGVTTLGLVTGAMAAMWPVLSDAVGGAHRHLWTLASGAWAGGTVIAITTLGLIIALQRRPRTVSARHERLGGALRVIMVSVVALDATLLFAAPLLSAPTQTGVDTRAVRYLQAHLGLYRFAVLGPIITPNFGAYYNIAELNTNDVPIPKRFSRFVTRRLDPNADPKSFTGFTSVDPAGPSPVEALWANRANYEQASVRYVVVPASGTDITGYAWPPASASPSPRLVYRDELALIYELPHPSPFFSSRAEACSLRPARWNSVTVRCPHRTQLVRRAVSMPGWTATARGRSTPIRTVDGVFQAVTVRRGTSTVRFTYEPRGAQIALAATGVAGLALTIATVRWARKTRASRQRREFTP
jgi:hypothetical protein